MTTHIEESGLYFGDYETTDFFHVEKADIYRALGDDIKTVEFVLRKNKQELLFVEAKSSSPQPCNNKQFNKFIEEITEKFSHSNDMFFSIIMNRIVDLKSELPDKFRTIDYSKVKIKIVLVINHHKIEWLRPIEIALRNRLNSQMKIWKLELAVLNDELAADYRLVKPNGGIS